MTVLRTAYVAVLPKTDRFDPELKKRLRNIDTSKEGGRHGRVFGKAFVSGSAGPFHAMSGLISKSIGGLVTGLGAVAGIRVFAGFIEDARASAKVASLTASTIRATGGAAKITAAQVGDLATAISNKTGKDDEAVQAGQNMLLTFKGIRNEAGKNNDIFNQASSVLTDMVSAMNGGVVTEENMRKGGIQLGKALNDPIKGLTALQRVGVTFTAKQKEQITTMVKAGNVAGAQKIILAELKSEFGGAAAATSSATDKMKVALGNLGEQIGGFLLPVVDKFAGFVSKKFVPGMRAMFEAFQGEGITSSGFVGAMERIGVAARAAFGYFSAEILPRLKEFGAFVTGSVVPALVDMAKFVARNREVFAPLLVALGTAVVTIKIIATVTKVWAAAQALWGAAFAASGVGTVIVLLAALAAGLIYAYKNSETFRKIVDTALRGVAAAAKWAWENVIRPAVTAMTWYFRNIIGPTVLWLWNNVVKPAWAGISAAVRNAWTVIQVALAAFKFYLEKVIFPVVRFLWNNVVKPTFALIGAQISFAWNKVIKPVFQALGGFIRDTVAPAFAKGVQAISAAWDKVKAAARTPVEFVVNSVINPLIGGFNKIAGALGVKDRLPLISLSSGNNRSNPAGRRGSAGDGPGLPKGAGDGPGDFLSFLTGPAKWVAKKAGLGRIKGRFGNNFLTRILTGGGGKVVDWMKDKALSLIGSSEFGGGGSVSTGGLRTGILSVLAGLRGAFGSVPIISGLRPGARTLSGAVSYHASGRAIDIAPVQAWAAFLAGAFGSRLRELITPWQEYNRLNGAQHTYTGAVWNQHNWAGGNAHIHAAMDDGGYRMLRPGWNAIPNWTGRPEPIAGPAAMGRGGDTFILNFHGPIASREGAKSMVLGAITDLRRERKLP